MSIADFQGASDYRLRTAGIKLYNFKCLDAQPTLTVLIRGSFGRQAWTLQLRHLPRHRSSSTKQYNVCPGRPVAMEEPSRHRNLRRSTTHFSESIERIPTCKMYLF